MQHRNDTWPAQSQARAVLLAFGANCFGPWGSPAETFSRALKELGRKGVVIKRVSRLYETAAMGSAHQPPYVNAVALATTCLSAQALLRVLKEIERAGGRRGGRPWGARTLDIDIVDYKGLVLNWALRSRGQPRAGYRPLVLPHAGLATRPFVLRPLLDVAPGWRHPATKESARALLRRLPKRGQGAVTGRLA